MMSSAHGMAVLRDSITRHQPPGVTRAWFLIEIRFPTRPRPNRSTKRRKVRR